jgi:4a-hydroxytetrahydrobiopterin dehydratase
MDLKNHRCVPCEGGTRPMDAKEAKRYLRQIKGWKLEGKSITTSKKFKDFKGAMRFVNKVADIAEDQGHHPDISVYDWNNVKLSLSTHAIKGLSINDFVVAAKINSLK